MRAINRAQETLDMAKPPPRRLFLVWRPNVERRPQRRVNIASPTDRHRAQRAAAS